MSRRRYISTDISTDVKMAELAEYGLLPLLLFTWAIPHMDDWGRITGDARQFKLLVCPALDVTTQEIDQALDQIAAVGLWERYEAEGKRCIAIPADRWFKHQSYINKAKREDDSGSNFPPPDKRRKSPRIAEDQQTIPDFAVEQQGGAQNAVSFSPSPSPSFSLSKNSSGSCYSGNSEKNVFGLYESEIGDITETVRNYLLDWEEFYGEEWTKQAIKEAVKQGIKKLVYIEGILKRWKSTGHPRPWELEKEEKEQPKPERKQGRYQSQPAKPKLQVIDPNAVKQPELSEEERQRVRQLALKRDGKIKPEAAGE